MALHDKVYIHPQNLPKEVKHFVCWTTEDLGLGYGNYLVDREGRLRKIDDAEIARAFYSAYYQGGAPLPDDFWGGKLHDYDGEMELTEPAHQAFYEGVFEKGYFKGMKLYSAGPTPSL
jgi:hypothetical protein